MKNFKRVLSLFLVFLMSVSLISVTGLTASASTHGGNCGFGLTWTLDTTTGVLDITGSGDMYRFYIDDKDYERHLAPWF